MIARAVTVTLRTAEPADDDLLRELFVESRGDLAVLPAPTRDVLIDLQFRAQQSQYAATFPQARRQVIVADGTDVGQLVLDDAGPAVRIVDVTVGQAFRGQGIGSAVLRDVIDGAESSGRAVELSVWSDNAAALRLYGRLSFFLIHDETANAAGYLQMRRNPTQQEDE